MASGLLEAVLLPATVARPGAMGWESGLRGSAHSS